MLIKFTVSNFLSFLESVTLDLEAGSIREFPKNTFTHHKGTQEIKLLKNVTLFGANSSGKTNFLRAFSLMRYWVLRSHSDVTEGKKIPLKPFSLNTSTENGPSKFEVHFLLDRIGYKYGFIADKEKIHQEWLFITTKRKEEMIFTRSGQEYRIEKGFQIEQKQRVKMFMEFTKSSVLFLTVLAQWNIVFAQSIVSWFLKHRMYFNNELDEDINITADLLLHPSYRATIYDIIRQCDLGFTTIKEELDDTNKLQKKYPDAYLALNEELLKKYRIKTRHELYNATMEPKGHLYFDLEEDESAGARKFIALLGPIVRALVDREIIWIDELDARLHTFLVNLLVVMINSTKYNNRGAQAIITTHNVQLFKKLRRDQMFLLEKNKYGISAMSSVYVGKPHIRGDAILDKEYLNAQLGGIPNINEQLYLDFEKGDE